MQGGRDEASPDFVALYDDGRGVARIYLEAVAGSSRLPPEIFRRGRRAVDQGCLDINKDGTWHHDFEMIYRK
jgi:hypothetical protein